MESFDSETDIKLSYRASRHKRGKHDCKHITTSEDDESENELPLAPFTDIKLPSSFSTGKSRPINTEMKVRLLLSTHGKQSGVHYITMK